MYKHVIVNMYIWQYMRDITLYCSIWRHGFIYVYVCHECSRYTTLYEAMGTYMYVYEHANSTRMHSVAVRETDNRTHFSLYNTFYSHTAPTSMWFSISLTRDYFRIWYKTVIHNNSEWATWPDFLWKHTRIQHDIYNKCTRLLFYESINVHYRQYDKTLYA